MSTATNDSAPCGYQLRLWRPGDMGTIIARHGVIYTREYKWAPSFEADCARVCADVIDNFDPALERCWIAESTTTDAGTFLGSIALLKDRSERGTAQLRLFLVEPAARGQGLGARLIKACIDFAREKGYDKLVLWTFDCLEGARRLYKRAGFEMRHGEEQDIFGRTMVHETWFLQLRDGIEKTGRSKSALEPSRA